MQHLVHLNIGRLVGGPNDPRMADFFVKIESINALAAASSGFVWRLTDAEMGAGAANWPGDDTIVATLSAWDGIESLEKFVWQSVHANAYARKHEWFQRMSGPTFVMWWVPAGYKPTMLEARGRLEHLAVNGGSEIAFGWEHTPAAKLWQEKRCA